LFVPDPIRSAAAGGTARVIIGLTIPFTPEGRLSALAAASQREQIAVAADRVVGRLSRSTRDVKRFATIPFIATTIDGDDLANLERMPEVASIEVDERLKPVLAQSAPLIGAPTAWAAGFQGTGWAVAVIDSGVQTSHPFLNGKLISEACYSTHDPDLFYYSLCPGSAASSTALGSGANCPGSITGCDHGTHVAGIAVGNNGALHGIAPDAKLIAVKVATWDLVLNEVTFFDSDVILGLERVYALRQTYNIAAVNLSLGRGAFTSACDAISPSTTSIINTLASVNIATIAASGNDGRVDAISIPACISTAISVGATTKADSVADYTNSAAFLDLLAPGSGIFSSVPTSTYATFSGTSMAAPHVAGAWAVMKQRAPKASVAEVLAWLQQTGVGIFDPGNGLTKPRIRLNQAAAVACTFSASAAGSFTSTGGAAQFNVTATSGCGWAATTSVPWLTITANQSGAGNAVVTVTVGPKPTAGSRTGTIRLGWPNPVMVAINQTGGADPVNASAKWTVDGDALSDIAVWRPADGRWYSRPSSSPGASTSREWGSGAVKDQPVPGDYDGDGLGDFAVWRPGTGDWFILTSTSGYVVSRRINWGLGAAGDIPVPADYDGDRRLDLAVWRPSTGTWYVKTSSSDYLQSFSVQWGLGAAGDKPVPGDYDGDGKADIAVWRAPSGRWFVLKSHMNYSAAFPFTIQWGLGSVGDQPVAGDYDGDGATDVAVWRGPTGVWYVLPSSGEYSTSHMSAIEWGKAGAGDRPVVADFDGDGRSDITVWRAPVGLWFTKSSSSAFTAHHVVEWGSGALNDVPVSR
jgi:hypothetical protein